MGVQTELVKDEQKNVSADKALESLRKLEVVVMRVLRAAEMLTEREGRMKERMEAISLRMEEALGRTADTENQLRRLEAQVSSCTKVCISSDVTLITSSYINFLAIKERRLVNRCNELDFEVPFE